MPDSTSVSLLKIFLQLSRIVRIPSMGLDERWVPVSIMRTKSTKQESP